MKIRIILLSALLLSAPILAATQQMIKLSSELNWPSDEDKSYCFSKVCAKVVENQKPGMFDKIDKEERRRLSDPSSINDFDSGNNHPVLNFSFGESK